MQKPGTIYQTQQCSYAKHKKIIIHSKYTHQTIVIKLTKLGKDFTTLIITLYISLLLLNNIS